MQAIYPKPGPMGGRIIRKVIALLKTEGFALPIDSHILIATSTGCDSTALSHLLIKYGRRVVSREKISLLHINHGWRGTESDEDARFIQVRAKEWGVPIQIVDAKEAAKPRKGESWENQARQARKTIFEKAAKRDGALIFTAHHANDLAETLLWRLFTGSAQTHGGGIAVRIQNEVRPFLLIKKDELRRYLKEEKESWREDSTNHEGRFLRSQMRQDLMTLIEQLFHRAVDHLVQLGLAAQKENGIVSSSSKSFGNGPFIPFFNALGLNLRRGNWRSIQLLSTAQKGKVHLPGGWSLEMNRKSSKSTNFNSECWILRKD